MTDVPIDQAPCFYCERDVMPPMNLPHAEECPTNTGIYPVTERDVNCPGGCGCYVGLLCGECDGELQLGDHYARLELGENVVEIVCLVCAAVGVVTR